METLVFVLVPIVLVAAMGLTALVRGIAERRSVFRSEESPEQQLEEQERLKALREAQERIEKHTRGRRP